MSDKNVKYKVAQIGNSNVFLAFWGGYFTHKTFLKEKAEGRRRLNTGSVSTVSNKHIHCFKCGA
jgi:hypothetical protein